MDPAINGRGAEPVYRDKLTGKQMTKEEFLKPQKKKEDKPKEIWLEWGKGLSQKQVAEARLQELEEEKNKSFARSRCMKKMVSSYQSVGNSLADRIHRRREVPPPSSSRHGPGFYPVDREKICFLLLLVFTKGTDHHTDGDFAVRGKEPKDEVQIYTSMDATLRELTDLVKELAPEARRRDTVLSFAFVYPTKRGRFVVRAVGITFSYPSARRPDSGSKALGELNFQIGDYLDVKRLFLYSVRNS